MAKIQLSDFVADTRGSVGGVTYSKGVGGIHIRKTKPIPSVSSTERQTFVRTLMAWLAGYWRELTDEQRSVWATFAGSHPLPDVFGVPRIYPAYDYFIKVNFVHVEIDLPILEDAPLNDPLPEAPVDDLIVLPGVGSIALIWTPPPGLLCTLDLWKFGPASAGRNPQVGDVRHLCYIDPAFAGPPLLFTADAGRLTLFARYADHVTGLLSPFFRLPPADIT